MPEQLSVVGKLRAFVAGRRQAYSDVFRGPVGDKVLKDLAKYCRANQSTYHPDARVHAMLEGRKQVFLRIQNHLNLSPEDLYEIYQEGKNPGD